MNILPEIYTSIFKEDLLTRNMEFSNPCKVRLNENICKLKNWSWTCYPLCYKELKFKLHIMFIMTHTLPKELFLDVDLFIIYITYNLTKFNLGGLYVSSKFCSGTVDGAINFSDQSCYNGLQTKTRNPSNTNVLRMKYYFKTICIYFFRHFLSQKGW